MFLALVMVVAQAVPSPPLQAGDADDLGVRMMFMDGGVAMIGALAQTREVPLKEVFLWDESLTLRAAKIARSVGIERRVFVLTVPAWRDLGIVNIESFDEDSIRIFMSPLLLEYGDSGLDGMLAHELAHMVVLCRPSRGDTAAVAACEHAVDLRSAQWVGKAAAIRGLCQLMAESWRHRYRTDHSHIIERIKHLRRANIP